MDNPADMIQRPTEPSTFAPHRISGLLIALGPVAIGLFLTYLAAPSLGRPMFAEPPALLGIPLQLVIMIIALGWGAIGGYVVATTRRPWVLPVALLVFTVPAIVTIVLGPAIVLVLENLG